MTTPRSVWVPSDASVGTNQVASTPVGGGTGRGMAAVVTRRAARERPGRGHQARCRACASTLSLLSPTLGLFEILFGTAPANQGFLVSGGPAPIS